MYKKLFAQASIHNRLIHLFAEEDYTMSNIIITDDYITITARKNKKVQK